jgi:hypothetical protein
MNESRIDALARLIALVFVGLLLYVGFVFTQMSVNPPKEAYKYTKVDKIIKRIELGSDSYYIVTSKGLFPVMFSMYATLNVGDCISINSYLKFIPEIDHC